MAKKSKKQSIVIVVSVVILGIVGYLGYSILESRYKTALEQEKIQWQEKNEKLTDKIDSLKKTISTLSGDTDLLPEEDITSGDKSEPEETGKDSKINDSIDEVERRIASFFVYLDKQDYIRRGDGYGHSANSPDGGCDGRQAVHV